MYSYIDIAGRSPAMGRQTKEGWVKQTFFPAKCVNITRQMARRLLHILR